MRKKVHDNKTNKKLWNYTRMIGSLEETKWQSNILEHCLEVSAILFYSTSLSFLSQK